MIHNLNQQQWKGQTDKIDHQPYRANLIIWFRMEKENIHISAMNGLGSVSANTRSELWHKKLT